MSILGSDLINSDAISFYHSIFIESTQNIFINSDDRSKRSNEAFHLPFSKCYNFNLLDLFNFSIPIIQISASILLNEFQNDLLKIAPQRLTFSFYSSESKVPTLRPVNRKNGTPHHGLRKIVYAFCSSRLLISFRCIIYCIFPI